MEKPNVGAILPLSDGRLLFGLRGAGLVLTDARLRLLAHLEGRDRGVLQPWHWTTALAEDTQGRILIGTRDGLFVWEKVGEGGAPRPLIAQGEAAMTRYVRRLYAARDGRVWIGTGNGAFSLEPTGDGLRIERVPVEPGGVLGGEVNAFVEQADGTLWIGAAAGLFHGPPTGPLVRIPLGGGFPVVVGLLLDDRGNLWVDTSDGLFRGRTREGFERVVVPGMPVGGVFGANLLVDHEGRLWSHRFVLDPARGRADPLPADLELDLGTGWFRSYAERADGLLLFGGSRGVLIVDPSRYPSPLPLTAPLLTEVVVGGRDQPMVGPLIVPPHARTLGFRFASPDLRRAERLEYRYRLRGLEQEWNLVDARQRFAAYRSLPPGHYVFEVAAGYRGGAWSAPRRIDVVVSPHWWERPVARIAAFLLVLFAIAGAWRLRTKALRRRAAELERRVRERTAQLSAAKDRAESALAELRRAQTDLVQAEKMASLGRMVAGLAHEINTPLGVALTAATRLDEIQRERFSSLSEGRLRRTDLEAWRADCEEGGRLLRGSLERATRLVQSLKRVAVDQTAEQRRRFLLADLLEELRITFAPRLKRSPHRLVIDCEPALELHSFPGALFQVLSNLLENAERHAFPEGRAGTVRLIAMGQGDMVRIELADDGVGMSPEVAARAFEPFFTTRREEGGSGLGLHLVYTLVTGILGGRVELSTASGQGCRFEIVLPRIVPEAGEAHSSR